MRSNIFNRQERQFLEAYLTTQDVDEKELSKILQKIKENQVLFEDVFLYLQVKKNMMS